MTSKHSSRTHEHSNQAEMRIRHFSVIYFEKKEKRKEHFPPVKQEILYTWSYL